jgi:hypothetical protein
LIGKGIFTFFPAESDLLVLSGGAIKKLVRERAARTLLVLTKAKAMLPKIAKRLKCDRCIFDL